MSMASIRQPIVIPDPPKSVKVVLEVCQTPNRTPTSSLKRPFTPGQTASSKRVTIIEPNPFAKSTPGKRKSTRNIVEVVAEFKNAQQGGKPLHNPFLAKKRKMGNSTRERLTKSEPRNNGNRMAPIHRKDSAQDSEKENYFAEKRLGHGTNFLSLNSTLSPRISLSQGTARAPSDYWAD
uniref:Uncharacterized protein n=1 Tax=Ditylenchus dipsaci TaxID=166011 RepID=A0A915CN47_9BILA